MSSELGVARETAVAEPTFPDHLTVLDTHTAGEPTRVIMDGWPPLRAESLPGRRDELRAEWDHLRTGVIREPRGHDAVVGALLTPAVSPEAAFGVIFFNNVGYLGMCGHGIIGVMRALEFQGRITPGRYVVDTPVGPVQGRLHRDGTVSVRNRPAVCHELDLEIDVPGIGRLQGDVVFGGNWFFMTRWSEPEVRWERIPELLVATKRIRDALRDRGVRGSGREEIDHIWLDAAPLGAISDSRSFVRCPGGTFDRSPCGTGTSAKLVALHARGELEVGEEWVQESIMGTLFRGWLEEEDGTLIPCFRGGAWVTGQGRLYFDPADPMRGGFGP